MSTRTSAKPPLVLLSLSACLGAGLFLGAPARGEPAGAAAAAEAGARFIGETPDSLVEAQTRRALAPKATEADAVAALAVLANVSDRTTEGVTERAVASVANAATLSAEVRGEAGSVGRALGADEGTTAGIDKARAAGILTDVSVLGPFRDTGGGLDDHDGPEQPKSAAAFGNPKTFYSWGTVEVAWRAVPPTFAQARGVPLDMFVHPRKESCSFVATKIELAAATSLVVRVAAGGTVRLVFDGVDLGKSDDVHALARLDRLAAQVEASAGSHLVAAKVCTGALEDVGRVRLRLTDARHVPLKVEATSDLALKPGEAIAWGTAKATKLTTPLLRAAAAKGAPDALLTAAIRAHVRRRRRPEEPAGRRSARRAAPVEGARGRSRRHGRVDQHRRERSGRLYRARSLAVKSGDAATQAFVDRRLIEQHLDTEMPDWAIASLRGAKLDAKKDDEALLLSARTLRALRVDALTVQAMRDLAAAFRGAPQKVPTALLVELSGVARSHDVALWLATTEELARRGIRGELLVDAMGSRGKDEVVKAAQDAFAGGMDDADEALSVARHVTDAGAHDVAALLYRAAARWAPNRPEAWAGLARELAAASNDPKDQQVVLVALRRARELAPGDAKYRAELALRSPRGKPGGPPPGAQEPRDDERWLSPIADHPRAAQGRAREVAAGRRRPRSCTGSASSCMHPDIRVSQLIQYAREIVDRAAHAAGAVRADPARGRRRRDPARARAPQGRRRRVPGRGAQRGRAPADPLARALARRHRGGRRAPVDEHRRRRPRRRAVLLHRLRRLDRRAPAPLQRGRRRVPARRTRSTSTCSTTSPRPSRRREGRARMHVDRTWSGTSRSLVAEEPLAPALSEIVPVIVGSTFKTWDDFRKWYAEAVRGFTEPDEQVAPHRRRAHEGQDDARAEAPRALRVRRRRHSLRELRERRVVAPEPTAAAPRAPRGRLRRQGDPPHHAPSRGGHRGAGGASCRRVMTGEPSVLLAKNVAIPHVRPRHRVPARPQRGHLPRRHEPAVAPRAAPVDGRARRRAPHGRGPRRDRALADASPDDHGSDVKWTITLKRRRRRRALGHERHTGDGAFWLRTNLSRPTPARSTSRTTSSARWFPTVEVDKKSPSTATWPAAPPP